MYEGVWHLLLILSGLSSVLVLQIHSSPKRGLFHIENFRHHIDTFSRIGIRYGLEKMVHELLPSLIHRIAAKLIPGSIEVVHAKIEKQILPAPEDRIIRDS